MVRLKILTAKLKEIFTEMQEITSQKFVNLYDRTNFRILVKLLVTVLICIAIQPCSLYLRLHYLNFSKYGEKQILG